MFYHCHCADAANAGKKYLPRPLFLQEILWGKDGWPYFGNGGRPQKSCALERADGNRRSATGLSL